MASLRVANFHSGNFQQASHGKTAIVTLVLLTVLSSAALAETRKEYRYTVSANANISVETQYGSITVMPGSSDEVVVTATLKSDDVEVDQQQNGNRIDIESHLLRGLNQQAGQVDYELQVPPDATVNLHSSNGPLSVERLKGDITLEGSDALVNVRNVENGHVHVRTMSGPITLTDVRNGHVEIASISGDIKLKSVSGPLVQASTGSGKIIYDGDFGSGGNYRFTTHNGDIEALVPVDVSADFRAHSMLGRVHHDFPLQPKHSRFPVKRDVPSWVLPARRHRKSCCALSVVEFASSNAEPRKIKASG